MRFFTLLVYFMAVGLATAGPARHVVLVSIDGLRPDAMQQTDTPALQALMRRGSYSLEAQTTLPSITLTSHTSMMTGVVPARHKVLWNDWDEKRGLIETQTIFDVAKAAGMKTAMFAGKPKFRHFDKPGRLDRFAEPGYEALGVAEAAADYFVQEKPELMMVHLADPDGAGHGVGWMTTPYFEAIQRADQAVADLVKAIDKAGLTATTALIVTADHGGHAKTHGTDMPEDMTIPWIAAGAGVRAAGKLDAKIVTTDTAATVVALLGLQVPAGWDGKPVTPALEPAVTAAGRPQPAAVAH
jgi:predicted AlkP superfamily pyrophosphatase or phosphodiesterase